MPSSHKERQELKRSWRKAPIGEYQHNVVGDAKVGERFILLPTKPAYLSSTHDVYMVVDSFPATAVRLADGTLHQFDLHTPVLILK